MKTCVKCGATKSLESFYINRNNADNRTGKCKDCYKKDVQANYRKNREYYLKYDKERRQHPEYKEIRDRYRAKYEAKHPEKHAAKVLVNHALESGKLAKLPCKVCGARRVEAHHEDYTRPLEVEWLCNRHHKERHGTAVDLDLASRGALKAAK